MWGTIWDRKYVQSKKEFQCMHMSRVYPLQVTGKNYWRQNCPLIPNGIEYARIERWDGVVDYFKPVEGSSICQMLASNDQHLWSPDGKSWVKPPYAKNRPKALGGSGPLSDELSAKAGGRKRLIFWGHAESSGGCCDESPTHPFGGWAQEFDLYLCGRPQGDIASVIDIFVKRLATPWADFIPAGDWGSGLPANLVKRLDAVVFWKPAPVHRRWAVPAHAASTALPQCLDITSPLSVVLERGTWRKMVAVTCCDERGEFHRPLCMDSLPWGKSADLCGRFGFRLCTRKELEHKQKVVGPCLTDHSLHWTSDECEGPVQCQGPAVDVSKEQVANKDFWEEKCKTFPPGTEFVRVVMGGVVDYFKPAYGHTICEMLLSHDKHLWSNDGLNWYQPPYSEDDEVLGGSALNWKKLVNVAQGGLLIPDQRVVLSHWGRKDARGGCCQAHRGDKDLAPWGLPFTMTSCVSDLGAIDGDTREMTAELEKASASGKASCPNPASLVGARDAKRIPDSAITATSYLQADYRKNMWRARLDAREDSWQPKESQPGHWIQWDFGRPVLLTAIQLKGNADNYEWVRTFSLDYVNDEVVKWTPCGRVFAGNTDHDRLGHRSFSPPILATKIKLIPITWHNKMSVRADFLGCEAPNGSALLLGPACEGEGCTSAVSCPEKQWPRSCQTEPVDSGAGAYVDGEGSCVAHSDGGRIQARLLCGSAETASARSARAEKAGKVLQVGCPKGVAPLSCNCLANGSVSPACGGEAEFLPSETVCSKAVPVGAFLSALCPVAPPPSPAKANATSEAPRIVASSPVRSKECSADNVLVDDGDRPGQTWIGKPFDNEGWFVMDLGKDQAVGGFAIRNTVNHFNQDSWTKNYTIEASADMKTWNMAAEGELVDNLDLVHVESAVSAMRYVKFTYGRGGLIGGGLGYFAPLSPEEMSELGAPMNGSKCVPPPGWCSDMSEMYSEQDCDGDGIPDPHCTNGKRLNGFLSSANGCTNSWPQGGCQGACKRPLHWCLGDPLYSEMDCDGDGIRDPFCEDARQGDVGFIGSAGNCTQNFPDGKCGPGLCVKPPGFCSGEHEELSFLDCDHDGVLDPFCWERTAGLSGFISSRDGCRNTWPYGGCHGSCRRPNGWCKGAHVKFDDSRDLDGDNIPDPACIQTGWPEGAGFNVKVHRFMDQFYTTAFPDLNTSGFISSRNYCVDTRHVGGKCRNPPGWCTGGGSRYFEVDCDFDGLLDSMCIEGGKSGFVSSAYDCANTWPLGGCQDWGKISLIMLGKMQCLRNGAICECNEVWCNASGKSGPAKTLRKDVDKDGIPDHLFLLEGHSAETNPAVCGTVASSRMCLTAWPNCLAASSVNTRVLAAFKELHCNMWSPAEIIFLLVTFVLFLFAYGICECPRCRRKRG